MNQLVAKVLAESRLAWQIPEVWEAVCLGGPAPEGAALAQALVRRLANPLPALEVFRELLARGELAAAALLADEPSFLEEVGESQQPARLHAELAAARQAELLRLQGRADFLRRRASRLAVEVELLEERLAAALEQTALRSVLARAAIAELEKQVEGLEERELAELRQRFEERAAGTEAAGRGDEWRQAVRGSLESRDLPVARWLLAAGPGGDERPQTTIPSRPRWPYSEPPAVVMDWFSGGKRPRDFAGWQLAGKEEDPAAYDFLDALAPLVTMPGALSAAKVAQLAHRLEALIVPPGDGEPVAPPVEEKSGGFWTQLRGTESPWLPALAPAFYPGGLPLLVTAGTPLVHEQPPFPLAIHLDLVEARPLGERFLRWTPRTLFRYLGDHRYRREHLLRELGAAIPLDLALPAGTPPSDGTLLEGRARELAQLTAANWQLVVGPAGIGKTSLIERAARDLERDGWSRLPLRIPEGNPGAVDDHLRAALASWHRAGAPPPDAAANDEAWVQGLQPERLLVTLDDAQFLLALPDRGSRLFGFMAWLVSAGGGRIRCWFAGAPSLAGQAGSLPVSGGEVLRLAALAHSTCRQMVQRLFDFYWVSLRSPDLLDRIVFYSGGHPRILFLLLRELFEQRGRHHGRSPFQDSHVEGAWISESLRQEAGRLLLAPLDDRPDLRLALGYVLQLAGEGISPDEIKEFIGEHGLGLDVVDELCELGIVERLERVGIRYRLPSSGLGQLIAERMGDGERWLDEAEMAWRETSGAPLLE